MEIKEEVLNYLAGFFDGEGCITEGKGRNKGYYWIELTQVVFKPINLFYDIFGGNEPKLKGVKGHRLPQYRYRVGSKEVVLKILIALYPYLQVKNKKSLDVFKEFNVLVPEKKELNLPYYLAGFFDAEGSVTIGDEGGFKLSSIIRVGQGVEAPLILFERFFGGRVSKGTKPTDIGSPIFTYHLPQVKVDDFYKTMYPLLHVKYFTVKLVYWMNQIHLNNNGQDPRRFEKKWLATQILIRNSNKGRKQQSSILRWFYYSLKDEKMKKMFDDYRAKYNIEGNNETDFSKLDEWGFGRTFVE